MTENLFRAYDLATDTSVCMESMSRDGYFYVAVDDRHRLRSMGYDDLATAANAVVNALATLEDDDTPTPFQALTTIAEWFGPDSQIEVEDHGDGPFIVNYADMDDD